MIGLGLGGTRPMAHDLAGKAFSALSLLAGPAGWIRRRAPAAGSASPQPAAGRHKPVQPHLLKGVPSDIAHALTRGEFQLHYQPHYDLRSMRMIGAEALVRWQHPERGLLMPGYFLPRVPAGEARRLLGEQVLRMACERAALFRQLEPDFRISVNLFREQLVSAGFIQVLRDTLAASGLPPHALELEITEDIDILSDGRIIPAIRAAHAMGVRIAVDDFGIGCMDFRRLDLFPFDTLKIDRSVVVRDDDAAALRIEAICRHAKETGARVIAEGVAGRMHAALLAEAGCHAGQSFCFCPPVEGTRLLALLNGLPCLGIPTAAPAALADRRRNVAA